MEEQAIYSFHIQETQEGHIFKYKMAKQGGAFGCLAVVLSISSSPLLSLLFFSEVNYVFVVISSVVLSFLLIFITNKRRGKKSFEITKTHLVIDSKKYSRKDITALFITDPKGNMRNHVEVGSSVVVGGTGITGVAAAGANIAAQTAMAAGQVLSSQMSKKEFKIVFRYGEKDIDLAKHLTQNTAEVMFNSVNEHLNKY